MKKRILLIAFICNILYAFPYTKNRTFFSAKSEILKSKLAVNIDTITDTIKKKEKKFAFMPMPTLTYDRSQGAGAG